MSPPTDNNANVHIAAATRLFGDNNNKQNNKLRTQQHELKIDI